MTPAQRLRQWADKIEEYGPDLTRWASPRFIVEQMRDFAVEFDRLARIEGAEADYQEYKREQKKNHAE